MHITLFRIVTVWMLAALSASAQTVPSFINYQGRLSDSNGAVLPTADRQLTFRIYDASAGGNLIWGPQIFDGVTGTNGHGLLIPVVQGYFNVMLGPTDVSNRDLALAFNGTNRFVEIQVSNNTAISPRQWIISAPYALNSLKLAGADWSAVFGTNDPLHGKIPATNFSPVNVVLSTTTTTADTSYANETSVPGLQVSIGTSGARPVMLFFTSGATSDSTSSDFELDNPADGVISVYRNSTFIGAERVQANSTSLIVPVGSLRFYDLNPPAGTNSYSVSLWSRNSGSHPFFHNVKFGAMEL